MLSRLRKLFRRTPKIALVPRNPLSTPPSTLKSSVVKPIPDPFLNPLSLPNQGTYYPGFGGPIPNDPLAATWGLDSAWEMPTDEQIAKSMIGHGEGLATVTDLWAYGKAKGDERFDDPEWAEYLCIMNSATRLAFDMGELDMGEQIRPNLDIEQVS